MLLLLSLALMAFVFTRFSTGPTPSPGSIGRWLIIACVVAGAVAIVVVLLRYLGIGIPPLFVTFFWIVLGVCAAVIAIKLIMRLINSP